MAAETIPRNAYRIWKPIPGSDAYRVHRTIDVDLFHTDLLAPGDVWQAFDGYGVSSFTRVEMLKADGDDMGIKIVHVGRINADDVEEGAARFEELPK